MEIHSEMLANNESEVMQKVAKHVNHAELLKMFAVDMQREKEMAFEWQFMRV
jgi:hypothetical protein